MTTKFSTYLKDEDAAARELLARLMKWQANKGIFIRSIKRLTLYG